MSTTKKALKFSGHDTFHCKEQWILKGVQLIDNEGGVDVFKRNEAIPLLGVGKNMVRSINHWLKSFGMIDDEGEVSQLAKLLFLEDKLDPYLESEGSLWLLQFWLCKTNHSSIFQIVFAKYFLDKATLDFSENQILNYVNRLLEEDGKKKVAEKTFNSDFKVFTRTYVSPKKKDKTIEDDFNVPLLSLNLISKSDEDNSFGNTVYRVNKGFQESITSEVFGYCLIEEFEGESAINYNEIRKTVGAYLCLSNEGLEDKISQLCEEYQEFVFKNDAGVKQVQIKKSTNEFKINLLKNHYGV
ncbi:MAG: DUF4007 family protein [Psychroflexus halocasei]